MRSQGQNTREWGQCPYKGDPREFPPFHRVKVQKVGHPQPGRGLSAEPWCGISSLQNREQWISAICKSLICGIWAEKPKWTNTVRFSPHGCQPGLGTYSMKAKGEDHRAKDVCWPILPPHMVFSKALPSGLVGTMLSSGAKRLEKSFFITCIARQKTNKQTNQWPTKEKSVEQIQVGNY